MQKDKTEHAYSAYRITQAGLNAYVMQTQNKTLEQAIEQNRRHFKDFDQLPKGKNK